MPQSGYLLYRSRVHKVILSEQIYFAHQYKSNCAVVLKDHLSEEYEAVFVLLSHDTFIPSAVPSALKGMNILPSFISAMALLSMRTDLPSISIYSLPAVKRIVFPFTFIEAVFVSPSHDTVLLVSALSIVSPCIAIEANLKGTRVELV